MPGASGTILEGPQRVGGHTWWKVQWDDGSKGWSADYLVSESKASSGAPSLGAGALTNPPAFAVDPALRPATSPVAGKDEYLREYLANKLLPSFNQALADIRAENKRLGSEIVNVKTNLAGGGQMAGEDKYLRNYLANTLVPSFNQSLDGIHAENRKLGEAIADLRASLAGGGGSKGGTSAAWALGLGLLALLMASFGLWRSWQQQPALLQITRLEEEVRVLKRALSSPSASTPRPASEPARTDVRTGTATKPKTPRTGVDLPVEQPSPKPLGSPSATGVSSAATTTKRPAAKPAAPGEPGTQSSASQPSAPAAVAQLGVPAAEQPGIPLVRSSDEDNRQLTANEPEEPPRETVGRVFQALCQQGLASYLDDLLPALRSALPGAEVVPAYHPTKAQELYFSDSAETSSLWYWRITFKAQHYLLPRPESTKAFSGIEGFRTAPRSTCFPENLKLCQPAVLEARGKRWEIAAPGTLA